VALVTGAATGIGLGISDLFARRGAIVIMTDRDGDRVAGAASRMRAEGLQVDAAVCDVRDGDAISHVVNTTLDRRRQIDILVSNAGVIQVGTIMETEPADFRNVMAINAEGPYRIIRACLPAMKERRSGVILQIASVSARSPLRSRFAYAVSKAASQMIVMSVASDMAEFGIRANAICPARVHTDMVDSALRKAADGRSDEETLASLHALQPLGRMIRVDEVAALALYLCSDEAAMVSGASYLIDGGLLAGI
jgi:NAD(P)-dependent dehydrogenase (short-subunit alcohol dehydrogenase family)